MSGIALLPSSVTGASATTFIGDVTYTGTGWRGAAAGGSATNNTTAGALYLDLSTAASAANINLGARLVYAA